MKNLGFSGFAPAPIAQGGLGIAQGQAGRVSMPGMVAPNQRAYQQMYKFAQNGSGMGDQQFAQQYGPKTGIAPSAGVVGGQWGGLLQDANQGMINRFNRMDPNQINRLENRYGQQFDNGQQFANFFGQGLLSGQRMRGF